MKGLGRINKNFKDLIKQKKIDFPQDVSKQLYGAITAVFYLGTVKEQKPIER